LSNFFTVIPRLGNKTTGWKHMQEIFLKKIWEHKYYCEPFLGSGFVLMKVKQERPDLYCMVGDLDNDLGNFWWQSLNNTELMASFLETAPSSEALFHWFKNNPVEGDLQRAVQYWYLCKLSGPSSSVNNGGRIMKRNTDPTRPTQPTHMGGRIYKQNKRTSDSGVPEHATSMFNAHMGGAVKAQLDASKLPHGMATAHVGGGFVKTNYRPDKRAIPTFTAHMGRIVKDTERKSRSGLLPTHMGGLVKSNINGVEGLTRSTALPSAHVGGIRKANNKNDITTNINMGGFRTHNTDSNKTKIYSPTSIPHINSFTDLMNLLKHRCSFLQEDYARILERADALWGRDQYTLYLDPPYVGTEGYYGGDFDHGRFFNAIKDRDFMLNYNDCPAIREAYAGCTIISYKVRKRKELFIYSQPPKRLKRKGRQRLLSFETLGAK